MNLKQRTNRKRWLKVLERNYLSLPSVILQISGMTEQSETEKTSKVDISGENQASEDAPLNGTVLTKYIGEKNVRTIVSFLEAPESVSLGKTLTPTYNRRNLKYSILNHLFL